MGIMSKIFGTYSDRELKRMESTVRKIESLDEPMQKLSDEELGAKTIEFKERLSKGESLDDILPEAFAAVREAAFRVRNEKHFRVQLFGGVVLHQGRISEMKTGEGKTLVATLPSYLNALEGKGVHIVTVNDYLANRDRDNMGPIHELLGLKVGVILHDLNGDERREAYNCDITYGTNSEFGFDYLRDNMVIYKEDKVQRGLNYAIVDEVDSILIDEARTPLIISGEGEKSTEFYRVADHFAKTLGVDDYTIDEKGKNIMLSEGGVERAEKFFNLENYADPNNMELQHHVTQALKANYIMHSEVDYLVRDGEVLIVDEFTGRVMEGRRYSEGLHQAIEAKESVNIEKESRTLATITYQNYFRMFKKLSGMTGTALTEENEFREIYGLDVIVIPTNEPMIREDKKDLVYKNERGKFNAIVKDIIESYNKGQPVLVGTVSIEKSERVSDLLKRRGVPHQVLNAKYHEKEAEIISHAGEIKTVTIATNMAGRGTDIKLGEGTIDTGGLKIIGTERHEARRIDNQLRGRSGRQGDIGESRFYISLEDELMRRFGSDRISSFIDKRLDEDEPIESSMVASAIENAQKKVEGYNFDIRKSLIQYDDVINKQREVIYEQRDSVLAGEDMHDHVKDMIQDTIESSVRSHLTGIEEDRESDINMLIKYMEGLYVARFTFKKDDLISLSDDQIIKKYLDLSEIMYEDKEKEFGPEQMREIERVVLLKCVDTRWMAHIDDMDHLKRSIHLMSYKQVDPKQAYQMEGSEMFEQMIANIKEDVTKFMFRVRIERKPEREKVAEETGTNANETSVRKKEPAKKKQTIGRNSPCPCGSGKKYKNCCGK